MRQVLTFVVCAVSLIPLELLASPPPPPPPRVLSISDQLVSEGTGGLTPIQFKVTLSAPGGVPDTGVSVQWFAENLTALAPDDFVAASGTVHFTGAGQADVDLGVVADSLRGEGSEVFLVRLAWPVDAEIGKEVGLGVIQDDDTRSIPRAKCDLDEDGRSNLLVLHAEDPDGPEPPVDHRPLHQDWPLNGPFAEVGSLSVDYDGVEEPEHWDLIAMDDFNGDGSCDLFWEHDGQVAVTLTSNGVLRAPHPQDVMSIPHPGPSWRLVGSGPFDADMRADLVWWDPVGRALQAWLWVPGVPGQAPTVSVHQLLLETEPSAEPLLVLDLNDGPSTGLLWRNDLGQLSYARMNGLELLEWRTVRYPTATRIDASWRAAAAGDFDGDGDEDLVWQKSSLIPGAGGRVAVWLLTGTNHVRETSASPELLSLDPSLELLDGLIDGPR